jgi:hypothetical protein
MNIKPIHVHTLVKNDEKKVCAVEYFSNDDVCASFSDVLNGFVCSSSPSSNTHNNNNKHTITTIQ